MNQELSDLATRDISAVLHPMAQAAVLKEQGPLMIVRGEGIYVYDEQGNQYIDGLAGLWCTSLGYANEEIAQTAYEQIKTRWDEANSAALLGPKGAGLSPDAKPRVLMALGAVIKDPEVSVRAAARIRCRCGGRLLPVP